MPSGDKIKREIVCPRRRASCTGGAGNAGERPAQDRNAGIGPAYKPPSCTGGRSEPYGGDRHDHYKNCGKRHAAHCPGGHLDTNTAPQLEAELKTSLSGITELELDFSGLEYISSAGLRVLLAAQKTMSRQGKMTIRNVNETIMEVFEITGFVEILTIV